MTTSSSSEQQQHETTHENNNNNIDSNDDMTALITTTTLQSTDNNSTSDSTSAVQTTENNHTIINNVDKDGINNVPTTAAAKESSIVEENHEERKVFNSILDDLSFIMKSDELLTRILDYFHENPKVQTLFEKLLTKMTKGEFQSLPEFQVSFDILFDSLTRPFPTYEPIFELLDEFHLKYSKVIHDQYQYAGTFASRKSLPQRLESEETAVGTNTRKQLETEDKRKHMDEIFHHQKIALTQKLPDGRVVFSSSVKKTWMPEDRDLKIVGLDKVRVFPISKPFPSQRFGSAVAPINRVYEEEKVSRIKPMQFVDHGIFSSFAPLTDSSYATLSAAETVLCCTKPKYKVIYELYEDPQDNAMDLYGENEKLFTNTGTSTQPSGLTLQETSSVIVEKDIQNVLEKIAHINAPDQLSEDSRIFLKEVGLDESLLLPNTIPLGKLLEENKTLVKKLQTFQDERYFKKEQEISLEEYNTVQQLKTNLSKLIGQVKPGDVITENLIKVATRQLNLYTVNYKGILHMNQPYAFSGNAVYPVTPQAAAVHAANQASALGSVVPGGVGVGPSSSTVATPMKPMMAARPPITPQYSSSVSQNRMMMANLAGTPMMMVPQFAGAQQFQRPPMAMMGRMTPGHVPMMMPQPSPSAMMNTPTVQKQKQTKWHNYT